MGDGGENVRKSWDTVSTMSGASSFSASRIDDLPRELPPTALRDPKGWSNEVLIALSSRRSYNGWEDADLDNGESIVFGCKKHFLCLQNMCIPKDSTDNKLAPSEEFPRCRSCHICESHETKMREVLEQRQAYSEDPIKIRQWEDWLPVRESLVEKEVPDPNRLSSTEAKAFRMLRGIRLEAEQLVADAKKKAEKLRTGNDTRTTTTTMANSMPKIEVSFGWFQQMLFRLGMGPDISMATIKRMYRKWREPMTHGQRRRRSLEGRFVPHDHEVDNTMKTAKGYVLKRLDSGFLNEKLAFLTAERMILITTKLLDVWKVRADEQEDAVALQGLEQFSGVKAKTKDDDDAIVPRRTAASMSRSTTSSSLSGRATTQLGRQTTIRNPSPPKSFKPSSPNAFSMSMSKPKLRPSRTIEEIDDITQSVGNSLLRRTMVSTGLLLGPEEKEDSARVMDRWSMLREEGNSASERSGSLGDMSMAVFEEIGKSVSTRSLRRTGMSSLSPRSSNSPRATSLEA